jgi:PAS domain S-box-containing protein
MRHVLEHGAMPKMQYSLRKKDGALAQAELSAAAIQDERGECIAFLTIVRDMTQLEQTERAA